MASQRLIKVRKVSEISQHNKGHPVGPGHLENVVCLHIFLTICFKFIQGWEFAHSLITHLLTCSDRSNQMSQCERFSQIAQDI